jgi:hypothetical protein
MNKLWDRPEWYSFRNRLIIERAHNECEECGRHGNENILQVHHECYIKGRKPWEYPDNMCKVLCKRCHAEIHGKIPPSYGWELLFDEDLGDLNGNCEFCGTSIRYVFYVIHPKWLTVMGIGTICCDYYTGTKAASTKRRYMARLRRFIDSRRWHNHTGYCWIRQQDHYIKISRTSRGYTITIDRVRGKKFFDSIELAKAKAFEVIETGAFERYKQNRKGKIVA